MNFGFHGRSFGAPAPVSNVEDTGFGGSITQAARQNKLRNLPDGDSPGFASAACGAYLGAEERV
jgi:hypothetical protein